MKNSVFIIVGLVILIGGGALWYFGFREKNLTVKTVELETPLVTAPTTYDVDEPAGSTITDPETEPEAVPELESSDPWVRDKLATSDPWFSKVLEYDQLIRKIVVSTDLLLRGQNPNSQLFFLKPLKELPVMQQGGKIYLSDASYQRYDHAIAIFESLDDEMLARTYKLATPLFRSAWNELGNGTQWEDQLDPLLEQVLAIKPVDGDIELIKSGQLYMFADDRLEKSSSLNKAFIRMGPDNLLRIQRKLTSIREGL